MNITVFGANGKVGRLVVESALVRGHHVTAFVHSHSSLEPHPNLDAMRGNVYRPRDVERALGEADGVISALSSWHTPEKNVLSTAMQHIVPAMQARGIKRIVSLTGAGAFDTTDTPGAFDTFQHTLLDMLAGKVLRDGEKHIRMLRVSDLDWTVVRSPVMNNYGSPGYMLHMTFPTPWDTINRQAVADCMVDLVESRKWLHKSPFIFRS